MATIVVPQEVNVVEDATSIQEACKGWGTDEKALISVLAHRNSAQRKLIREAYKQLYDQDLVKRLESELSGELERAVYRWILDPEDRDAVLAHVALTKSHDYRVIIEIAAVHSAEELLAVRRAYQARYRRSLEEDVAHHTTGGIRQLLVGLVTPYRYEGYEINESLAHSEATLLQGTIKKEEFTHEEVIRILTTRSKTQLMATFNRYKDLSKTASLAKDLSGKHDDFKTLLGTTVRCLKSPKKYYAKVLREAMKGTGTDEDAVTRVIVSRAEKDLKDINEFYYKRNNKSIAETVAEETHGHYKHFLLALLGA